MVTMIYLSYVLALLKVIIHIKNKINVFTYILLIDTDVLSIYIKIMI